MRKRLLLPTVLVAAALILAACADTVESQNVSTPASPGLFDLLVPETTSPGEDGDRNLAPAPEEVIGESGTTSKAVRKRERSFVDSADTGGELYAPAVVELGYEACRRIEYTAAADPEALVSALANDEIPYAADAIRELCPKFEDYLVRAREGR